MRRRLFTLLSLALLFPLSTFAQGDYGLGATAGKSGLNAYSSDLPSLAGNIIGAALSFIGILFFILTIYAGFVWMTAQGEEGRITKAKDTLIAAIIGIIITLSAYAITRFVFDSVGVADNQAPAVVQQGEQANNNGDQQAADQARQCQIDYEQCNSRCEAGDLICEDDCWNARVACNGNGDDPQN